MYIRKAKPENLDIITAIEAACFLPAEAPSRQRIEKRLAVYPDHYWLGFDEYRELICLIGGPVTKSPDLTDEMYADASCHDPDGDWQMLFSVCTYPNHRHQGNASLLLRRVIQECRRSGRKGLVLTCKEEKIGFYERFGFVQEGLSSSVHGGAVWYQMRLTFDEDYDYLHLFDISDDPDENSKMFEASFWNSQY